MFVTLYHSHPLIMSDASRDIGRILKILLMFLFVRQETNRLKLNTLHNMFLL